MRVACVHSIYNITIGEGSKYKRTHNVTQWLTPLRVIFKRSPFFSHVPLLLLHFVGLINWPIEPVTAKDKSFPVQQEQPEGRYVPFIDFMLLWLSDGCDEALELGVVDTVDMGELGLMMSLIGVVLPPWFFISSFTLLLLLLLLLGCSEEEFEWFVTFCCAIRSCFRNFARRFWNHT